MRCVSMINEKKLKIEKKKKKKMKAMILFLLSLAVSSNAVLKESFDESLLIRPVGNHGENIVQLLTFNQSVTAETSADSL
jgi:hypothetical protein